MSLFLNKTYNNKCNFSLYIWYILITSCCCCCCFNPVYVFLSIFTTRYYMFVKFFDSKLTAVFSYYLVYILLSCFEIINKYVLLTSYFIIQVFFRKKIVFLLKKQQQIGKNIYDTYFYIIWMWMRIVFIIHK
jgi:hypothetical protein